MLPLENTCGRAELCPGSASKSGATGTHRKEATRSILSGFLFFFLLYLIKRQGEGWLRPKKTGRGLVLDRDVQTKDFWAYWETADLLKYPWNEFRSRSGLLSSRQQEKRCSFPSKWTALQSQEHNARVTSIGTYFFFLFQAGPKCVLHFCYI